MKVAIIDDNSAAGESLAGLIDAETKVFESLFDARDWPADVTIVDISAISPVMYGQHIYSPIAAYLELFPGTKIILISGLPASHFIDLVAQVKEVLPEAHIEHRSSLTHVDWSDI